MDREKNAERTKDRSRHGWTSSIREEIEREISLRRESKSAVLIDFCTFLTALILARCHAIFGAYPFAIAFISTLPGRVWIAAFGGIVGALTLGKPGIIYAMICAIVVFLRIIISATEKKEGELRHRFSEGLLLRSSSALIGGFIAAVYEILLSGFGTTTVLFGAAMVLLPPLICAGIYGFFDTGRTLLPQINTEAPILSMRGKSDRERLLLVYFECSALFLLFIISLALAEYNVFGINTSYVFAALITLAVAKRLGALPAAAVGFASTLGLSSTYSVAFLLFGLSAGALFGVGISYALCAGGVALGTWCAYAGGVSGFLSVMPEYAIATVIAVPTLRKLCIKKSESSILESTARADDMVATMTLAYKNKYMGRTDALEEALHAISVVVKQKKDEEARPTREEYAKLIEQCAERYCALCSKEGCTAGMVLDTERQLFCAEILYRGGVLTAKDLCTVNVECTKEAELAKTINRAAAILAEDKFNSYKKSSSPDTLLLVAELIKEARAFDREERGTNELATENVKSGLADIGIVDGTARVLGTQRPYFIVAFEDENGEKIKSEKLNELLENAAGARLGTPELFRKGKTALMAVGSKKRFTASFGTAGNALTDKISGDTARSLETEDGRFYTLLSDGMGAGASAKETSEYVCELLMRSLDFSHSHELLLKLTNRLLRERGEESSATVDLFTIDLVLGNAEFIKCGAAPSYIKRGDSLFRIRSRTAPIGLMKNIDAEKIKASVKSGDYIIMLSDGINGGVEDAPWLLQLLALPPREDPKEYAEWILKKAEKEMDKTDDMTVVVIKITALE